MALVGTIPTVLTRGIGFGQIGHHFTRGLGISVAPVVIPGQFLVGAGAINVGGSLPGRIWTLGGGAGAISVGGSNTGRTDT